MASTANQQQPFPAVPPSQSAGDHEMQGYYPGQEAPRPAINQTPYLTPYLGFRARLTQTPINRWTILLALVLIRLMFAIKGTDSSLTSARREALSACTQVESIGSSMASMPHYMAQGVNEMTASGVEKAVSGLMAMLDMSVSSVEEIVIFVIHMMTSTYLCLITLAVKGSVGAAIEVGTEIAKGLNATIDEVTNSMGDAAKTVTDGFNSIIDKVQGLPFVPGFEAPTIDLSDEINKLKALEVPPEMQEGLQKLNNTMQSINFEDVQNFTDNIIRVPFEEVKKLIQAMESWEFDRQVLPVPQKEQLNFCSEGNDINNFFDDLAGMTAQAKKIGLGVLIVLLFLVIIPMAWTEYRRYKKMEERSQLFGRGHDAMDVVYLASRPHSSSWGLWIGQRFGSTSRQTAARWAFAYATSLPMLFILSLGIAGLFSCFCQYLLLKGVERKIPELTEQVAGFAEKVVTSLNNASMSWSGGVNGALDKLDTEINDEIFGWVNTTTNAVNGTLNTFVEKMSTTLEDIFGDTPLHEPIKEVLNCLIGLKIASFQKGLTWVQEHAHVNFPGVKNDTFSLGALAKMSDSSSAAELLADPNGKAKDEVTEAVSHVVENLVEGIRFEAVLSTAIIFLWLAFVIGGIIFASYHLVRNGNSYSETSPYIINPTSVDNAEKGQEYPDTAAPPYEYPVNKAAPYTLNPRPFPTFGPTDAEPHVGQVSRNVAEPARPTHLRASSHGHLADPSPSDEKHNPFASPRDEKRNPFSD